MRVLIAGAHPRDATLGSAKYLLRVGVELRRLGHEVDHLFIDDMPRRLRSKPRLHYLTFPVAVARAARSGRYDVVHVASGDGFLAAQVVRRPYLLINHVLGMEHLLWRDMRLSADVGEHPLTRRHSFWFGKLRLWEVEHTARSTDVSVCLSKGDADWVVGQGWQPPSRAVTIAPGIDEAFLDSPPATLGSEMVFFLGSWADRKGRLELLGAWPRIRASRPESRLAVAGAHYSDGSVMAEFRSDPRVAVLPVVADPPARLVAVMGQSAVGVFPSRYEGFGLAFLEMMALGLPVIATRVGGVPDVIRDRVNGYIIDVRNAEQLADGVIEMLSDLPLRRRIGSAARETAQQYTWARCGALLADLYQYHRAR